MAEKTCNLCGSEMQYDDFTRAWVCAVCGNSVAEKRESEQFTSAVSTPVPSEIPVVAPIEVPVEKSVDAPSEKPETAKLSVLEEAHTAILNKDFECAGKLLSDYRKKHINVGKTDLLLLLCGYQASSTEEILRSISSSSIKLEKLAGRADWTEMVSALPSEQRKYVKNVLEYCAISIVLLGDAKKIVLKNKQQPKTVTSSFAKMDEEELSTMKRMKDLERAREMENTLAPEQMYEDYEERFPSSYTRRHSGVIAPKDTGSAGLNVVLDVLDFLLIDDEDSVYRPAFSRTRDAAANKSAAKEYMKDPVSQLDSMPKPEKMQQQNTPSAFLTAIDRLEKARISKEELKSASEKLLEEISILENQILSL
ncbi:MAG: hypothetical protein IKG93_07930 [Clostridiales bacterium]|nr:hypothetical protein [Clostridiales bacterium]